MPSRLLLGLKKEFTILGGMQVRDYAQDMLMSKVTIGKPTPLADAGADITICSNSDGTVTLNANLPEGATGYWTIINVDNITPSAGFSYVSGGQFDPKSTIKVKPGKTRLKWTILSNDFVRRTHPLMMF
ncbi:MAG: hypothetical protein IPP89_11385 [Saprospiraceae bacterium]|nr:hypothetical protein [Candidatus Brachybacter algidus]MBL0119559.1 hypothetical protein [Candidatus Brachybacter algidus]